MSTLDREFLGLVHALQIYGFLIIGSPYPTHILQITNHFYIGSQRRAI